jgi:hypothetical protein
MCGYVGLKQKDVREQLTVYVCGLAVPLFQRSVCGRYCA